MINPLKVYAKDTSYNRHLKITRITTWSELEKIVEQDMKGRQKN